MPVVASAAPVGVAMEAPAAPAAGRGAPPESNIAPTTAAATTISPPAAANAPAAATPAAADDAVHIDPYIDSERCTTCNECTNLNRKMFAYNADKQAYVKDPTAGTFAQLVMAAEKCPVGAIHPGTPLNPHEKDLEKWLKRSQAF